MADTIGSLCDKLSIVKIKIDKLSQVQEKSNELNEKINNLFGQQHKLELELIGEINGTDQASSQVYVELQQHIYKINLELFETQDIVRDKENMADQSFNEKRLKLYDHIVALNNQRSALMNKINKLFGDRTEDIKTYKFTGKQHGDVS